MHWNSVLKTSRPRFWIYLVGPVLLGSAAALTASGHWSWLASIALLVFTFPANLFLYGVNDIFDQETDRLNPKKQGYESLLDPRTTQRLLWMIVLSLAPAIILLLFLPQSAFLCFLVFLFLGAFYSAPPIRAKAVPFLDALFNVLYVMPAFVAWYAFGGEGMNWIYLVAGAAWCMAMHAYSAIPDREVDRAAKIKTVATTLGKTGTLLFCSGLYLVATFVLVPLWGRFALVSGSIYLVLMMQCSRTRSSAELLQLYRWFPWVNTFVGFAWFWLIVMVLR